MNTTGITHRTVEVNGLSLHLAEAGPADGPVVLLLHGFPECWYSWRHQLLALSAAGCARWRPTSADTPAATRRRPSGRTRSCTWSATRWVCSTRSAPSAVVVGHDWGAPVAWHTAQLRPDRVRGVVGLSVPFLPRGSTRPTEGLARRFGAGFYQLHFQAPGVADAELGADPLTAAWNRVPIVSPALYVAGEHDMVVAGVPFEALVTSLRRSVTDLRDAVSLPGCGHWTQQERPAEVNRAVVDFVAGLA